MPAGRGRAAFLAPLALRLAAGLPFDPPTNRGTLLTTLLPVRLGLRANAAQFTLLVAVNALVGGMVGQQQTVLPLLAENEFGLPGYTVIFTYVAAFGITKAIANWFAGTFSDRYGRKPVLLVGWLFAVPVPLMLIWAPGWGWVVAANVLLGINQGLTWSTTVVIWRSTSSARPGAGWPWGSTRPPATEPWP